MAPRRSQQALVETLAAGVDGGGTRTAAVVTDGRGRVLGRGEAGSGNHHVVGWTAAFAAVRTALAGALHQAGLAARPRPQLDVVCLGMAGIEGPNYAERFDRFVRARRFTDHTCVVSDGEILLAAGKLSRGGIALVSGTGSICWGRNQRGETARAGGWGHVVGDEGSGFAVSMSALNLLSRTVDGRERADRLMQALLRSQAFSDPHRLVAHFSRPERTKTEIAQLAPVVFRLARAGERYARRIVAEAAAELAQLVDSVAARLHMARPALVVGGSLLVHQAELRSALQRSLRHRCQTVQIVREPALGAAYLALADLQKTREIPKKSRESTPRA